MADQAPAPAPAPAAPAAPTTTTQTGTQVGVEPPRQQENPLPGLIITFLPLLVIFYLFFMRPESKRRKQKEAMLAGIKAKDKVVTVAGLHGQVVEIDGDDVVLLVDAKKDVRMRFRRSAIEGVIPDEKEEKK